MSKGTDKNISHGNVPDTDMEYCLRLDKEINLSKQNGSFSTSVRFKENGNKHSIVIKVADNIVEDNAKLTLSIDGETFLNVKTKWRIRGNFVFEIKGVEVDFYWNLYDDPVKFSFHTIACDESENAKTDWEVHRECYATLIIGWKDPNN